LIEKATDEQIKQSKTKTKHEFLKAAINNQKGQDDE
jgi:hypothetical protein